MNYILANMTNAINAKVSRLIEDYMYENRLSQSDLAKILRVTPSNVCSKLKGKRLWKIVDLQLLANAGFDFSDLFTREV